MVQIDGIKHAECPVSIISCTPEVESIAKNLISIRSVKRLRAELVSRRIGYRKVARASV